jgi:phenylpropionate dioxygenase-like ring-hydroxylating dioxygenase large terminal subunit
MDHDTQVRLIAQALAAIDAGRPPMMTESFTRNNPAVYTSREWAERERATLFHDFPLVVGFSSQARNPGDYFTDELGPTPLLVVRGEDGVVRAFANICRHRGSRLAQGCGRAGARFVCPYHSWSYDTTGRLRAIPDDFGFAHFDRESHGLIRFPVAERYGMVWVTPRVDGEIDLDIHLERLAPDLASYGLEDFELRERLVVRRRMNWKLVSDTFWEAYHIKFLHRTTIAPMFVRNLALFDPFGLCHRLVGIRTSIEKLRGLPPERWDLLPHATILMNLFPNTVFVMQSDHAEAYRIYPAPDNPSESVTEINVLGPAGAAADRYERRWGLPSGPGWDKVMDLLVGVVEQDFEVGETIQRNFEAGVLSKVFYGRYEPALEHFHSSIRAALGE